MTTRAIFAGSFDPPTLGHLDVIDAASRLFDTLVVVVATNPDKKYMFTGEQRKDMLVDMTEQFRNVEVVSSVCLVADLARDYGAEFLVRGLRATSDYEYELNMSYQNRHLGTSLMLVTVGVFPKQEHIHVSSTVVRNLIVLKDARWKDYVDGTVAKHVDRVLVERP